MDFIILCNNVGYKKEHYIRLRVGVIVWIKKKLLPEWIKGLRVFNYICCSFHWHCQRPHVTFHSGSVIQKISPGGRAGGETSSCWIVTGSQDPVLVSKALMSFKGLPVAIEKPPNIQRTPRSEDFVRICLRDIGVAETLGKVQFVSLIFN